MGDSSDPKRHQFLQSEYRWHISQHYFAECKGEEIIEDLAKLTYGKRERTLLKTQLTDERRHVSLFKSVVEKIGLDDRAQRFANGYAALVKSQSTLAEKVFTFQILTESISSAYCEWRIGAFPQSSFVAIDLEVGRDEVRHLAMGRSMLNICDPDEQIAALTRDRKRNLIRSLNSICVETIHTDFVSFVFDEQPHFTLPKDTSLSALVSRTLYKESGILAGDYRSE
jgi:hypothetical protein